MTPFNMLLKPFNLTIENTDKEWWKSTTMHRSYINIEYM